eukprot:9511777-Prorocentrum_lima.AAC.1
MCIRDRHREGQPTEGQLEVGGRVQGRAAFQPREKCEMCKGKTAVLQPRERGAILQPWAVLQPGGREELGR